jgi:hypothetical protein
MSAGSLVGIAIERGRALVAALDPACGFRSMKRGACEVVGNSAS